MAWCAPPFSTSVAGCTALVLGAPRHRLTGQSAGHASSSATVERRGRTAARTSPEAGVWIHHVE
ncbi:hypothetical protein [Actinomycetospora lemnae]|uniref:Secreted protein n=1 Tax=Actinomycetospora lemnae TaxID=3019891 RepID=A0ABT5SW95_9PSEU|nr:hypothetical protein [Actinomycetospora sp. DW7H6]MDD7967125.1 hypothetical protein [Actinomycetospora sp. DW7H6]